MPGVLLGVSHPAASQFHSIPGAAWYQPMHTVLTTFTDIEVLASTRLRPDWAGPASAIPMNDAVSRPAYYLAIMYGLNEGARIEPGDAQGRSETRQSFST